MDKIKMKTPLVEIDGDEMTRILWTMIKDTLILPYIDLKTEYYDLCLLNRNDTDDQVTIDAALATKKYGVAVKCATITPNQQRMEEYPQLKKMWKSPNGTIRSILDGTVFRTPILTQKLQPAVRNWVAPITIARHAYGDIYSSVDFAVKGPGKCTILYEGEDGKKEAVIREVTGPAVFMGMHNTASSIRSFANACFQYALSTKQDLWFSTKDTISKAYDGTFKEIFAQEYEKYQEKFQQEGITYLYTLIDDAVARLMRSHGGIIWACKNYDGDVMSDMISSAYGSLAMMTSVLVSPEGNYEYEAAHGTVTRHYYRYLAGEETSTNPVATIFAWSGALKKRGELDQIPELCRFSDALEKATLQTIEDGFATKDLVMLMNDEKVLTVNTYDFLIAISTRLEKALA